MRRGCWPNASSTAGRRREIAISPISAIRISRRETVSWKRSALRPRPVPERQAAGVRKPSLPLAAEQERRDVGDAGGPCDRKGGGAADGERGQADARSEQAVEHAFAHARR